MEPVVAWIDACSRNVVVEICGSDLPFLLKLQKKLEYQRSSRFVDGVIIGNGESDFTKDNVEYEFVFNDKTFVLVDVPGIEGEENKYEHIVEQAVAKAHLIFYVNGTNKKPEAETAQKIKSYLRRDANVFAICNVRGKADSYEFEDDRHDLEETHQGAIEAKDQTFKVLTGVLGEEHLTGIASIQGLLGFSSVAFTKGNISTISRARNNDLIKDQNEYLRLFENKSAMRKFSRIQVVEDLIVSKLGTYKEDIVESNKNKIIRMIDDNLEILNTYSLQHEELAKKYKIKIDECIGNIEKKFENFSSSIAKKQKQAMNSFFVNLEKSVFDIINENFDNKNHIEPKVNKCFKSSEKEFVLKIEEINKSEIDNFSQQVNMLLDHLKEDMKKVRFENELKNVDLGNISFKSAIESVELNMKDIGGILFTVGSYALTGIAVGTPGGPLGQIIGGICGAIIGGIMEFMNHFMGKDNRIRKMQAKAREKIVTKKNDYMVEFEREIRKLQDKARLDIQEKITKSLRAQRDSFFDVLPIIQTQIQAVTKIKKDITRQPYESI